MKVTTCGVSSLVMDKPLFVDSLLWLPDVCLQRPYLNLTALKILVVQQSTPVSGQKKVSS